MAQSPSSHGYHALDLLKYKVTYEVTEMARGHLVISQMVISLGDITFSGGDFKMNLVISLDQMVIFKITW